MISFNNDYSEGTHPKVLEAINTINFTSISGYGEDEYCKTAANLIRRLCDCNADVHFLTGGTQTNLIAVASALRPHEGIIAPNTAHINIHETGAIEASGHKVIALDSKDGKLSSDQIDAYLKMISEDPTKEHMVKPAMVYISQTTECGTVYTKQELTAISTVCRKFGIYLYIDGARIAYALSCSDLTLKDYAKLCDMFYIGGTKAGALFGEALVIINDKIKSDFRYIQKQRGGMLAKGWLLGIQFEALLKNDLYFKIGKSANEMALKIKSAFLDSGCNMLFDSPSNQQFPILMNDVIEKLKSTYIFSTWQKIDNKTTAVRFCTSWATDLRDVERLCLDIKNI